MRSCQKLGNKPAPMADDGDRMQLDGNASDDDNPQFIDVGSDPVRVKRVRCMGPCGKKLYSFARCRRCNHITCGEDSCYVPVYDCAGWHDYSESACESCRDQQYSQVVDGKYYCPTCAPPAQGEEYRFKLMVADTFESRMREYYAVMELGLCPFQQIIDPAFLNDHHHWARYQAQPEQVAQEIRDRILQGKTIDDYVAEEKRRRQAETRPKRNVR